MAGSFRAGKHTPHHCLKIMHKASRLKGLLHNIRNPENHRPALLDLERHRKKGLRLGNMLSRRRRLNKKLRVVSQTLVKGTRSGQLSSVVMKGSALLTLAGIEGCQEEKSVA